VADTNSAPVSKAEPEPVLGLAGESSDPAVHQALADLEGHERNGDKDGVKAATQRLTDLGVAL